MNILLSVVCTECYDDDAIWLREKDKENQYALVHSINESTQFQATHLTPSGIRLTCKCGKAQDIWV